MASSISASLSFIFGRLAISRNFADTSTGDDHIGGTGLVGTGGEALPVGDVGTEGLLFIYNTHASQNVLVALDGGTNYDIVILPGHFNLISVGTTGAVYVKGSDADTTFEYYLTEE